MRRYTALNRKFGTNFRVGQRVYSRHKGDTGTVEERPAHDDTHKFVIVRFDHCSHSHRPFACDPRTLTVIKGCGA